MNSSSRFLRSSISVSYLLDCASAKLRTLFPMDASPWLCVRILDAFFGSFTESSGFIFFDDEGPAPSSLVLTSDSDVCSNSASSSSFSSSSDWQNDVSSAELTTALRSPLVSDKIGLINSYHRSSSCPGRPEPLRAASDIVRHFRFTSLYFD